MIPITVGDIKDRLVGLDQWFAAAARSESRYDDAKITSHIPGWIRDFERFTTFRINPVQIVSAPDGTYDPPVAGEGTISCAGKVVTGVGTSFTTFFQPGNLLSVGAISVPLLAVDSDTSLRLELDGPAWSSQTYGRYLKPVLVEPGYPYYQAYAEEFFMTTFRERPLLSVQRFRLLYNGRVLLYTIPPDWFSLDTKSGRFWMLPSYGSAVITGAASALAVYGTLFADYLPNLLFFDYTAGLPEGWQYTAEWSDVKRVLTEHCARKTLEDIAHAIAAGQSSKTVSGAGISQSFNPDRFMSRKKELEDSVNAFKETLMAQETPFYLETV